MVKTEGHAGWDLHREFVGMLFALAIAEVAVQASTVVNSDLELTRTLPSYTHLILAATVITASWVGWGQSAYSLSNIKSVFSRDFVELAIDLWLVALYFLLARGVELPMEVAGQGIVIVPSLSNETSLLGLVFGTYLVWDVVTKFKKREGSHYVLLQRGWASAICFGIASVLFCTFPVGATDAGRVVLGDVALLALVVLFRAMKVADLSNLSRRNWALIVSLLLLAGIAAEGVIQATKFGQLLSSAVTAVIT